MGTENVNQHAQGAEDQNKNRDSNTEDTNAKTDPAGNAVDEQELVGGMSTDSPTDQQPSASQNNQWEREHHLGTAPITGQQGSEGYEDSSRPARQYSSTDDDELRAEQPNDYRTGEYIEENDLEKTDQDYRDGENQSGEDQDDADELREGK
ncbi:MAG: hypothetical protein WBJ10_10250 [Daejeonella sp.]|uniref:hypothetical protein n=1 Tax=Daejeonella sp. TaxID=2805397 RepID=UPI003C76C09A